MRVRSLDWEDPLEQEMTTHSSIVVWKIPWTQEPASLQSKGLKRVGHTVKELKIWDYKRCHTDCDIFINSWNFAFLPNSWTFSVQGVSNQ